MDIGGFYTNCRRTTPLRDFLLLPLLKSMIAYKLGSNAIFVDNCQVPPCSKSAEYLQILFMAGVDYRRRLSVRRRRKMLLEESISEMRQLWFPLLSGQDGDKIIRGCFVGHDIRLAALNIIKEIRLAALIKKNSGHFPYQVRTFFLISGSSSKGLGQNP
jgi:hypothetical protein